MPDPTRALPDSRSVTLAALSPAASSQALALVAAVSLLLCACSSPAIVSFPGPPPVLPEESRELAMFDGASGQSVAWDDLVQRALDADAVLIGELHGHPLGLGAAAALFDDLLAARPDGPAVALEFIERDRQLLLDDFADGIITEKEFVKLARLSPGNYPPGHRSMVLAAIAAGRPALGANAPRRYVTLARKEGFQRLAELDSQRAPLVTNPEMLLGGDYRRRFAKVMNGDELSDEIIENFFRSQNVWDATMADTVVNAQRAGAAPIVLVIGRFHIGHNGGTLQRIRTAAPQLKVLTIAIEQTFSQRLDANNIGLADVVIYAGPLDDED